MTGAAHRLMSIELFLHVKKASADPSILLLETAVRISELIYLPDEKRTPRRILELYNITWLHHELCSKLFQSFHGDLSRNKFCGSYLHSLVIHAPLQFEIISLHSVNTENQERYFNQARRAATDASNHQPQNVIPTILLRLQAKAEYRDIFGSVQHGRLYRDVSQAPVPAFPDVSQAPVQPSQMSVKFQYQPSQTIVKLQYQPSQTLVKLQYQRSQTIVKLQYQPSQTLVKLQYQSSQTIVKNQHAVMNIQFVT